MLLFLLNQFVGSRVGEDNLGLELAALFGGDDGIGHDDDDVAHLDLACRSTVQADGTAAALAGDGIGVQSLTVVNVYDLDALALDDAGGIQEVLVDGDAANVVEVSIGHRHTVNLGFHDLDVHISVVGF